MSLTPAQRSLVSIGTSVGAGCQPCLEYHMAAGTRAGLSSAEMEQALAQAESVRRSAAVRMSTQGPPPATAQPAASEQPAAAAEPAATAGCGPACGPGCDFSGEAPAPAQPECGAQATKTRICAEAVRYVRNQLSQPPKRAILSCEGACIKGEVARQAANILAYNLERESAVRICQGEATTGHSGMIDLVKRAPEVIAVEGCPLHCATEILKTRMPELQATIIDASQLYTFDRGKYFEIWDLPRSEIEAHAETVARHIQQTRFAAAEHSQG